MKMYAGKHPVFVSHIREIDQMAYFLADLQHRLQLRGEDRGEKYDCLLRVKSKCSDLLLRMSAEDSEIILLTDADANWVRKIVGYVHDVILKDARSVG